MWFKRGISQRGREENSAPGRIDVLGGSGRHHGAWVFESVLSCGNRVAVEEIAGSAVVLALDGEPSVEFDFQPFKKALRRKAPRSELRGLLQQAEIPERGLCLVSCLLVFCETRVWIFEEGLRITIDLKVPPDADLGEKSAAEIALLLALEKLAGRQFLSTEAARIAHGAETDLMGLPSALADKLASAYGEPGVLLPILCQPDKLYPAIPMPEGVFVVAFPGNESGEERANAALKARTATVMGQWILEKCLRRAWHHTADIPLSLFLRYERENVPLTMKGAPYYELIGSEMPSPLNVYPQETYNVNAALRFAIEEHARCSTALALLQDLNERNRDEGMREFGELMLQSHEGYSPVGLGSREADRRVDALMEFGPEHGIYGARLSGEGVAGTVVALMTRQGLARAGEIRERAAIHGKEGRPLVR